MENINEIDVNVIKTLLEHGVCTLIFLAFLVYSYFRTKQVHKHEKEMDNNNPDNN